MVGRGGAALLAAIDAGFRESALATYAADRGATYDREEPPDGAPVPRTRRVTSSAGAVYRRAQDPADWTPMPDGTWQSPRGLRYPPMAACVVRVIAARAAVGLPTRHPDAPDDVTGLWERVTMPSGKIMWRERR
jgi:hypothetical protein